MATDIEVEDRTIRGVNDEDPATKIPETITSSDEPCAETTTSSNNDSPSETTPSSPNDPHPETDEIIRQVEYYFSDENLPGDAYLLAKSGGDGNGPVSIKSILGFPKMRHYKPKSRVIASIKLSTKISVVDNKFLQRREPLEAPLRATPSLGLDRIAEDRAKTLREKPWLTKGMLKPTGFEEYATEGPMRPDEYAVERRLYDPEEAFHIRIENAVARYFAKRKMHALNANIFTQFLIFGGFDACQRQFSGGLKKGELEKMTADEIALAKSNFAVADMVLDGLSDEHDDESANTNNSPKTHWTVDFLLLTKAFLSSPFLIKFPWTDPTTTQTACTVLPNFHNYLLYHDVCPEYTAQILAARDFCKTHAEPELLRLSAIDRAFPGGFNKACSTLFGGRWADLCNDDDPFARDYSNASAEEWAGPDPSLGLSPADAFAIFATAIMAYGTAAQMTQLEQRTASKTKFVKIHTADVGLEVLHVELLSSGGNYFEAEAVYSDPRVLSQTRAITPLGKMYCKIWTPPHRPLPSSPQPPPAKFREPLVFFVEDAILEFITPAMKMEATVSSLDLGVLWLDSVQFVYPSFFEWCGNETVREKEIYGRVGRWSEWLEEKGREGGKRVEAGDEGGAENADRDEADGGVRVDGLSDEGGQDSDAGFDG